jgi:hypothetical protein
MRGGKYFLSGLILGAAYGVYKLKDQEIPCFWRCKQNLPGSALVFLGKELVSVGRKWK